MLSPSSSAKRSRSRFAIPAVAYSATPVKLFANISEKHPSATVTQKAPSAIAQRLPDPKSTERTQRFREFELDGRVYVVTGGAQGLGLGLAEAVVEAGGHVYCLDVQGKPNETFLDTQQRLAQCYGATLHYRQVDVQHAEQLETVISAIGEKHSRMDGLIAAAAIQRVEPALTYPPEQMTKMMNVNYGGVYYSAVACARQMIKYKTAGSMLLVGSMSGLNANKGLTSSVYNSSKAAVIQLGRSLAMEWGQIIDGKAIRVNVLSPGNIMTPMVEQNFKDDPSLKETWERANMMGRLSEVREYRGAALFMLSDASSFMTGSNLVIDGGYTAW
ncbi:hypothetical protein LTR36_008215 [Oleoguttula mirabilis]|uniref:Uncharacterized protein n=1 Tax=Oleoguttula mirabilis TaxID=1507867 RepID=A0AAV9J8H4_9PEZI|nr:hypothetical protein LTR36_008215 [Oleoguttula mirabilis]